MKINSFLIKFTVIFWAILCITIFIITPGRVSYLHWVTLSDWNSLAASFGEIDLRSYITDLFQAFMGIIIFFAACVSLGSIFTKAIERQEKEKSIPTVSTWLAQLGTAFLLGHGLFSLIFLALASLYRITPAYAAIILIVGTLMGTSSIGKVLPPPPNIATIKFYEHRKNKSFNIILLITLGVLISSLFYTSARQSYDASAIYFSDAKISALTNRANYYTDDTFVASVLQSTIQYTVLIQLFGDQAARMLSWISGLVVVFFSIALGEKAGLSQKAKTILTAFILSSTAFLDLMGDGKVDLISCAPAIAAVYWIVVASKQIKTTNRSMLLLIGSLMGLAIVARPFNIFLLGVFILLYFIQKAILNADNKATIHASIWIGIGVIGIGVYHLLANWAILGNPLAFLSSVSNINPSVGPWENSQERIILFRLLYPIAVTFINTPQSLGNITPLFLAFIPIILIPTIRKRLPINEDFRILLISSSTTLLIWIFLFFTVLEIRYVMFLWIIIFIPVAKIAAAAAEDEDHLISVASNGLIIIFLSFIMLRTTYISIDSYSPLDKQGNPQCEKSRFCEYLLPINSLASPGDRVLTLSAFRYYLRTDLFACSTGHQEYRALQTASATSDLDFWEEVYRQGYSYIAYENDYTVRHLLLNTIPSPENTPSWLKLEPIYGEPGDFQVAYKIHLVDRPFQVEKTCRENSSGIWEVLSLEP